MFRKVLLLFALVIPLVLNAQYWEVGSFLGVSNYNGEFSEDFVKLNETHFTYGGIVRVNFSRIFSLKANIYKGMISGTDQNAEKYYNRRWTRNLSFRSKVFDIGIQPEINLRGYRTGHFTYKSSPYIFAGISLLRFNPQAYYNDSWINLQPLGTEGQYLPQYEDRKYKLTQIVIPFGFGWKYSLTDYVNLGFEASARKTFTDYLDDCSTTYVDEAALKRRNGSIAVALHNRTGEVSAEGYKYDEGDPRGSPDAKDWYYFAGFTISYSFIPRGCMKY